MSAPLLDTPAVSSATLHFARLILSGTSDSPGVRHGSSLASSHTHIRAGALSLCRALSHSFTAEAFRVVFSGIFGCSDDWSSSGDYPAKRCMFNPVGGVISARGGAAQSLQHLRTGHSIPLQDLLDVFLLLTLQNTQEVLQLGHGEGVPLQIGR